MRTHTITTAAAAFALTAALALDALAAANGCFYRNLERLDTVSNPIEGGDNAFFTRSGGSPPLGFMVFANTPAMFDLPGFDPAATPSAERGCAASSFLNSRVWFSRDPLYQYSTTTSSATSCTTKIAQPAQHGLRYDSTFIYPRIDDGCYLGSSYKTLDTFDPNLFYSHRQWNDSGSGTGSAAASVCFGILSASEKSSCEACLSSGKPYYIPPSEPTKTVYRGNFLHFYGPIYLGALAAWKTVISSNAKIIWGHGYYDNNLPGLKKGRDPNPACNKLNDGFNTSNRGSYINDFSNSPPPFGSVTKFPLAQSLFSMGFFLTDPNRFLNENTYVRTGTNNWTPNIGGNQDTICSPCQASSVIVITDGQVSDDTVIHPEIKARAVPTPADRTNEGGVCSTHRDCGTGLRCLGLVCTYPLGQVCSSSRDCGTSLQCVGGLCQNEFWADDVTDYFYERDVRDSTCGITATNPTAGKSCEPEKQSMITYVINVGRGGNAALNSVAKKGGTERAFDASTASDIRETLLRIMNDIIRRSTSFSVAAITTVQTRGTTFAFIPRFRPSVQSRWEGHLFRYKLFNEFAAGCTKPDTEAPLTPAKLARNPNGDADCDDVYLKDRNNRFVGENDEGDFMILDTSKAYPWPVTTTEATPVWDGAARLSARNLATNPRKIYTVVDSDFDGIFEPSEQLEFSTANLTTLMPYLSVGWPANCPAGGRCNFCGRMQQIVLTTYATQEECATDLINFVRGHDVLDDDEDGNRTENKEKILGDIFHSSPILVTPPAPRYLCDLGVSNQCVYSLYGPKLTPNGELAYGEFADAHKQRDHFVLVGANDGMVHAFHAGTHRTGDDPETLSVETAGTPYFDLGTGEELWAFIPPDMLAKLKRTITEDSHQLFVDGTAMVRDIWSDTSTNPGKKDGSEYHTVAVFGERQGGRSWFALDVTSPTSPSWRWGWPQSGSTYTMAAGESWNDFAPNAPPIVPIAVADTTGPLTVDGVKAKEVYAVFLNGGYDVNLLRGRSVSAFDVWTGRRLWTFAREESSGTADPRDHLFPVAAPVATLDLGPGPNFLGTQDGLFDTAVVGDVAGQLWTFRFFSPGKDSGSDGLFDNWHGARSFVQFKGDPLNKRSPFFQLASTTILLDSGQVRAYIGSGDRRNIRDAGPGECSLRNLSGCIRRDCSVAARARDNRIGNAYAEAEWSYAAGGTSFATNASNTDTAGISSACSDVVDGEFTVDIDCGTQKSWSYGLTCDWGATTSGVACPYEVPKPLALEAEPKTFLTENARFYSVKLFDTGYRAPFRTYSDAQVYDGSSLTETDLVNADLTLASSTSSGFFVKFPAEAERTASGTGILAGCVIWNTLTPDPNSTACGGALGDQARLYRAHYITGSTQCGNVSGVAPPRSIARTSIVPPPAPTPVVALNPTTGEVRYSMVAIEPGASPSQTSVGQGDISGLIYWLEVPRQVHNCRHGTGACE